MVSAMLTALILRQTVLRHAPRQRGFTLIEIMVVVIIIALLAAVVVPQFLGRVDDARVAKAKQDIQAIDTALTLFKLDNFKYPSTDQGLAALAEKPVDPGIRNWRAGGYLKKVNKDPWGNDYQYSNPGAHGEYDLYSLGAEAQPGGEGPNAALGTWNLDP